MVESFEDVIVLGARVFDEAINAEDAVANATRMKAALRRIMVRILR
jgi:hypothetical protein